MILKELATRLTDLKVSNCNRRQLYDYLKLYRTYPQIVQTVSAQFRSLLPTNPGFDFEKMPTASAQLEVSPDSLINRLSYSMFKLLVDDDATKRSFYELECIRGNWSVRELKRQINSLYNERSGLSTNKKKLSELTQKDAETSPSNINIRDPYIFEFLGPNPSPDKLDKYLINHFLPKNAENDL